MTVMRARSSDRVPKSVPITRSVSGGRRVEWSRMANNAVGDRLTERGAVVAGRFDVGGRGRDRWRKSGRLDAVVAAMLANTLCLYRVFSIKAFSNLCGVAPEDLSVLLQFVSLSSESGEAV